MRAQSIRVFKPEESRVTHNLPQRLPPPSRLGQSLLRSIQQFRIEVLFIELPPDGFAGESLDELDTGLAPLALLRQRLNHFQSVKAIVLGNVISNRYDFAESRAAFDINGRTPPGLRQ